MLDVLTFDRGVAVSNGSIGMFLLVFKLEITVNFIGILYYIMNVCIDYRTRSSMNNVRRIHQFIYATCPFNHIIFIVQKLMIILEVKDGYDSSTTTFQIIQFCRLFTTFIAFTCLPAYAIERSFATYFHQDYEEKKRSYIGYMLGFLTYLISFIFVAICLHFSATFYPFLALLIANILSYLINIINYKINHYYYNCSLRKIYSYSLTERYQISENIQFAKFFHIFALTIFLLVTVCSFFLLLATSFSFTSPEKNVFLTVFDTLFLIYLIYTPYVHYKYNSTWQHEFKKCMKMYNSEVQCSSLAQGAASLNLKTTFGEKMNVGKNVQMDIYFSQLVQSWNTTKPSDP